MNTKNIAEIIINIKNKQENQLDLSYRILRKSDFEYLSNILKENIPLKYLNLSGNSFSKNNCLYLSEALKTNTTLYSLDISKSETFKIHYIAEALKVNNTLKCLYLNSCEITEDGMKNLSDALQINNGLQKLDLGDNNITIRGIKNLVDALKINHTLQKLDLSCTDLGREHMQILSELFKINKTLRKLTLYGNVFDDNICVQYLASILETGSLCSLDICFCQINNSGVIYLSNVLEQNTTLHTLNISSNEINGIGFIHLIKSLTKNKSLRKLRFENTEINHFDNKIKEEEVSCLSELLKFNSTLQQINLSSYKFYSFTKIAEALEHNNQLEVLILNDTGVEENDIIKILNSLKNNTKLKKIMLNNDFISNNSNEIIKSLSELLISNSVIEEIYFYKKLNDDDIKCLIDALKINKTLKKLRLQHPNELENVDAKNEIKKYNNLNIII